MTSETAEVLPCPFCGEAATVRRSMQEYPAEGGDPAGEYEDSVTIGCDECGFQLLEEYRSEVVERWNRRPASDALQRQRDEAYRDLSEVSGAIGSVRWMDPPDGGDVSLAEQVRRMRADLEAAEAQLASAEDKVHKLLEDGWIVGDGAREHWRFFDNGILGWTEDPTKAVRYARRVDAEEAHRDDDDVWCVIQLSALSQARGGEAT